MRSTLLFLWILFACGFGVKAQEFNAKVTFNIDALNTDNKAIFENLQTQIEEFLNFTKFTEETYGDQEKIDCTFDFRFVTTQGNNAYGVKLFVSSSRPVFNALYKSPIFKILDDDVTINVSEFTRIEFTNSFFRSNLSSVLCYYAYIMLGLDHDSFSPQGGTAYYNIAQDIVRNAQGALPKDKGWSVTESNTNRHWLVDEMTDARFSPLREFYYGFHMTILDKLYRGQDKAHEDFVTMIKEVDQVRFVANNFLCRTLFSIKAEEIYNIASSLNDEQKMEVRGIMVALNSGNSSQYWNKLEASNGKDAPKSGVNPVKDIFGKRKSDRVNETNDTQQLKARPE